MPSRFLALLFLPFVALLGCGANSSSTPAAIPYNFNGNWKVFTPTATQPLTVSSFTGTFQVSNGSVTGNLIPISNGQFIPTFSGYVCPAVNQTIASTGTLDSSNNLVLTFPISGGTATLLATLGDNPATPVSGSWQIVGGACALYATPITIEQTSPTTPPSTQTVQPTPPVNLNGNWAASANYVSGATYTTQPVNGFSGALQFSNGSVTGALNMFSSFPFVSTCYNALNIPTVAPASTVTGTLDSKNNLTLTTQVAGGTATFTATLDSNAQTLVDGSLQIVGGPCAVSAIPMTIAQYAPITGTYKGTFNVPQGAGMPIPGTDVTVTAVLTQSTIPNASGVFPINGTITATGACTASDTLGIGTVTGPDIYSAINGPGIGTGPFLAGASDPTATTIIQAQFTDSNGSCSTLGLRGNLIRQ